MLAEQCFQIEIFEYHYEQHVQRQNYKVYGVVAGIEIEKKPMNNNMLPKKHYL
jgi:hypothetical protein